MSPIFRNSTFCKGKRGYLNDNIKVYISFYIWHYPIQRHINSPLLWHITMQTHAQYTTLN